MSVTYVGQITVGESIAGLSAKFRLLSDAIASIKATISVQVSALATAKATLEATILADLQAQFDASVSVDLSLAAQLTDPTLYISTMLRGCLDLQANLGSILP